MCFIILFHVFIKTSITKDYIWYFWKPQQYSIIAFNIEQKHTSEAQLNELFIPSMH